MLELSVWSRFDSRCGSVALQHINAPGQEYSPGTPTPTPTPTLTLASSQSHSHSQRVRATGSGPTNGMFVLSAARQR
eukprot:358378-Chlamydomonas_euryale.AAC.5